MHQVETRRYVQYTNTISYQPQIPAKTLLEAKEEVIVTTFHYIL